MRLKKLKAIALLLLFIIVGLNVTRTTSAQRNALKLTPRRISLAGGKSFSLSLPEGFDITVAAEG
jgi:hypothetical protein